LKADVPATQGEIRLRHEPSIPVAVVRQTVSSGELAKVVPASCGEVWSTLRAQERRGGRNVAIYWDGSIRLEAGAELDGDFEETERVVRSATPAGLAVSVTHLGPYHRLGAAHEAIRQWCSANRHRFLGPSWEIYGHWQDEWNSNPSRIQTDVYYLVAGAASGESRSP
jgi:effector-binding domain-containing protein